MIKIGLIGTGYWGKNLVRVFNELKTLEICCDVSDENLNKIKALYSGLKITNNTDIVFKNADINGVVISTPAVTHYDLAKKALMSGKHVFVEKPLSLKISEAEELLELSNKNKKILMVGHILQYHPAIIKLKELIDNGELGKIQYIYSNRLNIGKIRSEENILWSFAPHDISVMIMLLNELPERIFSTGGNYLQSNIVDVTVTTMDFKDGVKAHIFVSWLHPYKEQKLVVVGDKKMAVFDDVSKEKLFFYPHKIDWKDRIPVVTKAESEIVEFDKSVEPLKAECKHFLECIEKNIKPKTDGAEGLKVLRVLNLCQESLNRNGAVVLLSGKKTKMYYAHSSAFIDDDVKIGEGTTIWHVSHILKGSGIGENCRIGQNVIIGPNAIVGNGCKIQNNVSVYEGVTLEDDVFCGPSMVFTNIINPRSAIPRMHELKKTLLKKGATIGANATIVCGHIIGKHAFIGAGAVVTKDVPDYALMIGNPAKQAGWMCECGVKLKFNKNKAVCNECGKKYILRKDRVESIK